MLLFCYTRLHGAQGCECTNTYQLNVFQLGIVFLASYFWHTHTHTHTHQSLIRQVNESSKQWRMRTWFRTCDFTNTFLTDCGTSGWTNPTRHSWLTEWPFFDTGPTRNTQMPNAKSDFHHTETGTQGAMESNKGYHQIMQMEGTERVRQQITLPPLVNIVTTNQPLTLPRLLTTTTVCT